MKNEVIEKKHNDGIIMYEQMDAKYLKTNMHTYIKAEGMTIFFHQLSKCLLNYL